MSWGFSLSDHLSGLNIPPRLGNTDCEITIQHSTTLELTENTVVGPYISKEEYLESHYKLLREDAVAPLRDVISEIQVYVRHIFEFVPSSLLPQDYFYLW